MSDQGQVGLCTLKATQKCSLQPALRSFTKHAHAVNFYMCGLKVGSLYYMDSKDLQVTLSLRAWIINKLSLSQDNLLKDI